MSKSRSDFYAMVARNLLLLLAAACAETKENDLMTAQYARSLIDNLLAKPVSVQSLEEQFKTKLILSGPESNEYFNIYHSMKNEAPEFTHVEARLPANPERADGFLVVVDLADSVVNQNDIISEFGQPENIIPPPIGASSESVYLQYRIEGKQVSFSFSNDDKSVLNSFAVEN